MSRYDHSWYSIKNSFRLLKMLAYVMRESDYIREEFDKVRLPFNRHHKVLEEANDWVDRVAQLPPTEWVLRNVVKHWDSVEDIPKRKVGIMTKMGSMLYTELENEKIDFPYEWSDPTHMKQMMWPTLTGLIRNQRSDDGEITEDIALTKDSYIMPLSPLFLPVVLDPSKIEFSPVEKEAEEVVDSLADPSFRLAMGGLVESSGSWRKKFERKIVAAEIPKVYKYLYMSYESSPEDAIVNREYFKRHVVRVDDIFNSSDTLTRMLVKASKERKRKIPYEDKIPSLEQLSSSQYICEKVLGIQITRAAERIDEHIIVLGDRKTKDLVLSAIPENGPENLTVIPFPKGGLEFERYTIIGLAEPTMLRDVENKLNELRS